MHDSVKRSAAAGQRGRQSSANMFDFNDPYMTSPDSVQVKTEPQDYAHQSTFPYDMAHGLPLTPSVSAHGWQDQSIPGTTACYNTAVSAPDYSGLAYYQEQQYPVPSMIDSMQYPVFTSSGQVQALYYQSGFGVNQNCHPDYAQIPSRRKHVAVTDTVGRKCAEQKEDE
ncbi:C2H2 finger domain protein [Talaromyces pinophilus]|uniref:C2H2 finger domain protein n=1 Tax=Talaromyces pinophilus TaxID=128442 RepID=A0A6V8H995_TALPI|nr:C2H2 finger domain protein [Talaromyces pinophilus]